MTLYNGAILKLFNKEGEDQEKAGVGHTVFEVVEYGTLFDNKESFPVVKLKVIK